MANVHGLVETDDFVEFSHDPVTGIREWIKIDEDDTITIRRTQDVSAILEASVGECNLTEKSTPYGDIARVGQIPLSMWYDPAFGLRGGDPDAVKAFLRNPDYAKFRTRVGKV
jgi:hypothetical protein